MLVRILLHWRWLVLGAIGVGLLGAVLASLLTSPVYRASVTLEANPPSVAISDEQSRQQDQQATDSFDFVATQVGLLGSRAVAERTAQELNLANNPDIVPQEGDASQRLRLATNIVQRGLKVIPPEQGQLIKFDFDSTSPQLAALIANGVADSFINTSLQRRYEASAYARNFLERQINKTRGDLEKSERAVVAYAQQQGIITTPGGTSSDGNSNGSDTNSLQGESLVQLNSALAAATARRCRRTANPAAAGSPRAPPGPARARRAAPACAGCRRAGGCAAWSWDRRSRRRGRSGRPGSG